MTRDFLGICLTIFIVSIAAISAIRDSSRPKHEKVVVCYVASWAAYRPGKGQFEFDNLRPEHCTHIVYSFAGLNASTWEISSLDAWADLEENYGKGNYKKMTKLRKQYPGLKVSLAIGGWNEKSENYSALVSSAERRNKFVSSVIRFLKIYEFDGLDLDWEYPGKRGGKPADRANFAILIKELKTAFTPHNWILSAALSVDPTTIDEGYDVPMISNYLDFIHVMAYDYYGAWSGQVLPNAPLKCKDKRCVEASIDYLMKLGAPANKLVVGLPMYGRTFILTTKLIEGRSPMGEATLKTGFQGNYTREDGFMGYNEICKELVISPKSWRTGWDEDANTAWAVHDDKVILYDNGTSFINKIKFVEERNLAGVMVWSIDTDDFRGECGILHQGFLDPLLGIDYPLMRLINKALANSLTPDNNIVSPSKSTTIFGSICVVITTALIFSFRF